jgi:hypothetical protein
MELGAETPFYISSAELDFARRHADRYVLYRVYGVLDEPRFFALEGDIALRLELNTMTYRARIARDAPSRGRAMPSGTERLAFRRGIAGR